jgi:hypothetical protein
LIWLVDQTHTGLVYSLHMGAEGVTQVESPATGFDRTWKIGIRVVDQTQSRFVYFLYMGGDGGVGVEFPTAVFKRAYPWLDERRKRNLVRVGVSFHV